MLHYFQCPFTLAVGHKIQLVSVHLSVCLVWKKLSFIIALLKGTVHLYHFIQLLVA